MAEEIVLQKIEKAEKPYEVIEIKGSGHPDSLSDELAEELSVAYSRYTKEHFGAILHHNFDKVGILGGEARIEFGSGRMTKPIRVLVNGRASSQFGDEKIPLQEIVRGQTFNFFKRKFLMLSENDVEMHYNFSYSSSPGKTDIKAEKEGTRKHWFAPRSKDDLKELKFLGSNDTSLGAGYAPQTELEHAALALESHLSSEETHRQHPWLGTDIKIMAVRNGNEIDITMCVPQICLHVKSSEEYQANMEKAREIITAFLKQKLPGKNISLFLNTRDDYQTGELYLTFTGSSIENGDEGLVGRGNRTNGMIAVTKPWSMEGASGKNPVYHVGKIYNLAAQELAESIQRKTGGYVETYLISQSGKLLTRPWKAIIGMTEDFGNKEEMTQFILKELDKIPSITERILEQKYRLH